MWKQSGKSGGTCSPMTVSEVKVFTCLHAYLVLQTKAPLLFHMQTIPCNGVLFEENINLDLKIPTPCRVYVVT